MKPFHLLILILIASGCKGQSMDQIRPAIPAVNEAYQKMIDDSNERIRNHPDDTKGAVIMNLAARTREVYLSGFNDTVSQFESCRFDFSRYTVIRYQEFGWETELRMQAFQDAIRQIELIRKKSGDQAAENAVREYLSSLSSSDK